MSPGTLDVQTLRKDFPVLQRTVRDSQPLVYLDSGATSQKPYQVLDAERRFYEHSNAAVHRGAHQLAEEATEAYEGARRAIAAFIGAEPSNIVFTKNATEGLNLLSYAFTNSTSLQARGAAVGEVDQRLLVGPGDNIVVTAMEHHANLIPWQQVCAKTGAQLRWFGLTDDGRLDVSDLTNLIDARTKAVSVVHQSNILGTINPVRLIMDRAHAVGAWGIVDACQSVPHQPVRVAELGADAMVWSGHKMLGPTGIGCLWATTDMLNAMPPFLTGGSMIETVTMERSTFAPPPQKFEAGVPMVAQAVGLHAAVDYLNEVGMDTIAAHEHDLTRYLLEELQGVPGVRVIGPTTPHDRGSAVSFTVEGIHPHDVGQVLDSLGVAVRVGHHCAWPVCQRYSVPATTRISPYLYNDYADIDAAVAGVRQAQRFFLGGNSGV